MASSLESTPPASSASAERVIVGFNPRELMELYLAIMGETTADPVPHS
jgi:hypothetical protein